MEDPMAKSAKKSPPFRSRGPGSTAKPLATGKEAKPATPMSAVSARRGSATKAPDNSEAAKPNKPVSGTKQSRVLAMLRSPAGATIAAMMQATAWQRHSVHGFLAGVVRKRLNLKLISQKLDGTRIYQITDGSDANAGSRQRKARRAA
jgi:Protein of unknown function (DUF3489)